MSLSTSQVEKLIENNELNKSSVIYLYVSKEGYKHYGIKKEVEVFCGRDNTKWLRIKYNKLASVLPNTDLFDRECEVCQRALLKLKNHFVDSEKTPQD